MYSTSAANSVKVGQWVYVAGQDELAKVKSVDRATGKTGALSRAFGADLSAEALVLCDAKGTASISVASPAGGVVTVYDKDGNSTVLPVSTSMTFNSELSGSVEPISVDGATNNPVVSYPLGS